MRKDSKIFIAGHSGMVGSAITRLLVKNKYENLILRTHTDLDLLDNNAVKNFFSVERPDVVVLAAARVGGIQANIDQPAEFLFENLRIQNNVIHESYLHKVKKFCFLGSSCIFPRKCPQPMKEEHVLTGSLEPTNEGYAIAKIVGLKLIEYYRKQYGFPGFSLMPCNLYGTNDNFDPLKSHVLSALVKKTVDAVHASKKNIDIWGTGVARREFMHVDDMAEAVLYFLNREICPDLINIGWGEDISIKDLAELIANLSGFDGEFIWDSKKPEGMLKKCMDVTLMNSLGFSPRISLSNGIIMTIREYKQQLIEG